MERKEWPGRLESIAASTWWMLLVQGVCLILFGLLVLLVPEVLVFLVAMLFVVVGAFLVSASLRVRRHRRDIRYVADDLRMWFFRG